MDFNAFSKSLIFFYRYLRTRLRSAHATQVKLCKYPSEDKLASGQVLICDVEGGLLRSSSTFPYFMLVALEGGGFLIRGLLLLLLYPLVCLVSHEVGLRLMVMVAFCGLRKDGFRVGRAVLPKFLLENVGFEGFKVLRRGGKRVCVSSMPRVMVEAFLKEYMEVEVILGRELKEFGGYYTGLMEEENKIWEGMSSKELFGEGEMKADVSVLGCYLNSFHHRLFSHFKVSSFSPSLRSLSLSPGLENNSESSTNHFREPNNEYSCESHKETTPKRRGVQLLKKYCMQKQRIASFLDIYVDCPSQRNGVACMHSLIFSSFRNLGLQIQAHKAMLSCI